MGSCGQSQLSVHFFSLSLLPCTGLGPDSLTSLLFSQLQDLCLGPTLVVHSYTYGCSCCQLQEAKLFLSRSSWSEGGFCHQKPISERMEDAADCELSLLQVWFKFICHIGLNLLFSVFLQGLSLADAALGLTSFPHLKFTPREVFLSQPPKYWGQLSQLSFLAAFSLLSG